MACTLTSSGVQVELMPISVSTTISAGVNAIHAQVNNTMTHVKPHHDRISLVVRQGDRTTQDRVVSVLQRWQVGNIRLAFRWPEKHFDYNVLIESVDYTAEYATPVQDATVGLYLLTNMVDTSLSDVIVSHDALQIIEDMLEHKTIGTATYDMQQQSKDEFESNKASKRQWDGVSVMYGDNGSVRLDFTVNGLDNTSKRVIYNGQWTPELSKAIQNRDDLYTYVRAYGK